MVQNCSQTNHPLGISACAISSRRLQFLGIHLGCLQFRTASSRNRWYGCCACVGPQLSLCTVLGSFKLEKPFKIINAKQQRIVHVETFLQNLLLFVCITARVYALLAIFNLAVYQYTAKKVLCDHLNTLAEKIKELGLCSTFLFYRPVAHLVFWMSWVWAEGCWWLQSVLLKQWTSCTWVLMLFLCWNLSSDSTAACCISLLVICLTDFLRIHQIDT